MAAMNFHRVFAGPEPPGDLFIEQAGDDQFHYLTFAGGERLIAVAQLRDLPPPFAEFSVPVERLLNRVEQLLSSKRLHQEFNSARLHGLNRHRDITVPGDEYDRKAYSRFRERALKIQTAHPGKSDVENQAAGAAGALAREKLLRRRER